MSERWFVALPHGGKKVDIRAKPVNDVGMGSRFICEANPEDGERIVAAVNAHAEAERTIAALRSALDRSTAIVESMAAWLNDSGETCNRGNPDGGGIYPCDHCTIEEMMREAHAATEQAEPLLLAAIAAGSPDDRGED